MRCVDHFRFHVHRRLMMVRHVGFILYNRVIIAVQVVVRGELKEWVDGVATVVDHQNGAHHEEL